ncbi:DUF4282 domain-containing protein [Rossellomorea oryzaecorticis]|uniref:DUF4282 domain-containing protein n=1 Tax=Rossellomorea oryzaecorticis TaxID=1396505 RepID=A0ABW8VW04_9BACI
MDQFLNFNKMITPTIIKAIFWVGVVISVISGLIMIISGAASGGIQIFGGLLTIVIDPLLTRIYCELLIVLFKMHEALQTIKENSTKERMGA